MTLKAVEDLICMIDNAIDREELDVRQIITDASDLTPAEPKKVLG
jgi:hypothetical protein